MAERLHILCVDEDEDALFIAGLCLALDPYIVVESARTGSQALAILSNRPTAIDCVLLEKYLPDMNGAALLGAMRGLPQCAHIPAIFLTASVHKLDLDSYAALGAAGMVSKPYDPLTLAQEIRRILEKR